MRIKAVLFDLFDTLLLVKGGETFYEPSLRKLHKFLRENAIKTDYAIFREAYFRVRDVLYEETAETLEEPHFNIRVHKTLRALGYEIALSDKIVSAATQVFAGEFMRYVDLDEAAVTVLRKLDTKYCLGVVSNFAIPECLHKLLERFSLDSFFDTVVVSATVNRRKPSPEIFNEALNALDVNPFETVFVGDTPAADIKGANDTGIFSVLIERNSAPIDSPKSPVWKPPAESTPIIPNKVIRSLSELPALLDTC